MEVRGWGDQRSLQDDLLYWWAYVSGERTGMSWGGAEAVTLLDGDAYDDDPLRPCWKSEADWFGWTIVLCRLMWIPERAPRVEATKVMDVCSYANVLLALI